MFIEFILILLILLLIYWKRNENLPPGPINWLGIGGLIAVQRADPVYPHVAFQKLADKYGDILYVTLGVNKTVVFSRYEDMLEIFSRPEFNGRYEFGFSRDRSFNKQLGLLFSSKENWSEIRKFTQKGLRDVGFRKSEILGQTISRELKDFIASLKSGMEEFNSKKLRIENTFTTTVVNVIWHLIFGFQSKECEAMLHRVLKANDDMILALAHGNINQAFPILRKIMPRITGYDLHLQIFKEHQLIFSELIAEAKRRNENSDSLNFIHSFQNEIEKNKDDPNTNFTDEGLLILSLDLFLAGSETTSHFLSFAILHLVLNPEIQKKIQAEINAIVPVGDVLSYDAIEMTVYTQAFMYEIFRYCNIVPIPLGRISSVDYKYKGYLIPKGCCVMYNLHSVFNDKKYWGDPQVFRPERFIDQESGKLVKTERVIVFGIGKRLCIGDTVAKQTAFLYLTGLLNNFSFSIPPGQDPPSTIPKSSFTSKPYPFDVLVKNR